MDEFLNEVIKTALEKAALAAKDGEVPVCAVIFDLRAKKIISTGVNRTETDKDPTAHAEMIAIKEACRLEGTPRLPDYDMYVTLEPCPMCAAAISFARLRRLYFGAYDVKGGGVEHGCRQYEQPTCMHRPEVYGGFAEQESSELLKRFFQSLREEKNDN